jgi:hypothetical protein
MIALLTPLMVVLGPLALLLAAGACGWCERAGLEAGKCPRLIGGQWRCKGKAV